MNLLVIGDNHGDIENTLDYVEKLEKLNFDLIIYIGDFGDINPPKGFKQTDVVEIFLEELSSLEKPILAIPGNNDEKDVLSLIEKKDISIHKKGKIIGEFGFYGFGGAKTPFMTPFEPSDEEMEIGLNTGYNQVLNSKHKIQITHVPPYGTNLDIIRSGVHVGSYVVRNFIESKKPILAVCGHIHEAKGTDMIGGTVLLNPGKFSEGYFGLVDVKNGLAKARVLNLVE
ncbi:MAG: metallophosphoesterase family protein [Candidatus Aenigmatarchaeota archaeon]